MVTGTGATEYISNVPSGDLIAILQKPNQISAADSKLRAACAETLTTVLEVLSEVQEAYAEVQSVEAKLLVLEQRQQIVQRLPDLANTRLRAGEGIRLDVLTLESQRLALAVETTTLRLERTEERLVLARLIGEPSGPADWQLSVWQEPPPMRATEKAWTNAALKYRPEIRARTWDLAAPGYEVKLTRLAPFEGNEAGAHAEHDLSWDIGPTVTLPIPTFDWGQAKRAKAIAQQIEARHQLLQLQRQVIEEVRRAYAVYAQSRQAPYQARNELLPLQQKRREQAELAYKAGEADLTTLLLAESDLQETRAKLVELQEKVTVAMIRLRRAVGGAGVAADVEAMLPATAPTTRSAETGPSK